MIEHRNRAVRLLVWHPLATACAAVAALLWVSASAPSPGSHRRQKGALKPKPNVARSSGKTRREPADGGEAADEREIADAALELLEKDRDLDDEKFTPPAAIGLSVIVERSVRKEPASRPAR